MVILSRTSLINGGGPDFVSGHGFHRPLKNSIMLAFEGAHLQVRRCKTFILSFRGAFAPRNLLFLSTAAAFFAAS
jgi:hypothetical protein